MSLFGPPSTMLFGHSIEAMTDFKAVPRSILSSSIQEAER